MEEAGVWVSSPDVGPAAVWVRVVMVESASGVWPLYQRHGMHCGGVFRCPRCNTHDGIGHHGGFEEGAARMVGVGGHSRRDGGGALACRACVAMQESLDILCIVATVGEETVAIDGFGNGGSGGEVAVIGRGSAGNGGGDGGEGDTDCEDGGSERGCDDGGNH